jgi:hypothetical protein
MVLCTVGGYHCVGEKAAVLNIMVIPIALFGTGMSKKSDASGVFRGTKLGQTDAGLKDQPYWSICVAGTLK